MVGKFEEPNQLDSEERLRQAYDLLEGITEGTQDLIAAKDSHCRFIFFNKAFREEVERIHGLKIEVGSNIIEALAHLREDQEKARKLWHRALRGETFTVTEELGDPGRQRSIYEIRFNPLRDSQGNITGAAHIVRNVTARVRAEEELRRSEALYRTIARNIPDGAVWVVDRDMRILVAEGSLMARFGFARERLEGRTIYEALGEEEQKIVEPRIRRAFAGETTSYETRHNGLTLFSQYVPLRDEKGQVQAAMDLILNISGRKEMEAELRESEQRFRALSEAVPQIVWASDPEGRAYYFNSRWLSYTGQTIEEAKDLGWLGTVHPEDLPRAQDRWTTAVDTGTPYEVEYRVRGKDGQYRWFLSRGLPQRNGVGTITHWFGTCTDITEHKSLEETLNSARRAAEEASRAKSEFLANMSHEIRTPMTVFLAVLEHLLQIDDNPERRQLLEMADKAGQRLHELIDDILDFSRIEARRLAIEEEPFDLRTCVRNAMEMMSIQAREKNLRLEAEFSPVVPLDVVGDAARLGQVLINLIGNAVKFTPEGEVKVTVDARGNSLYFNVIDTGIGIPEDQHQFIFETFKQVDSSLTRKYGGTGLGLAITKGLVELMGGAIGVKGRDGRGSIFFFTLPLKIPGSRRFQFAPEPKETAGAKVASPRILIAEDDPMVRDMIRMLLDRRGWPTETAETGLEAVARSEKKAFDLILMDVHMPGMNGLETARRIREMEKGSSRHCCIIGLTADARREIKNECLAAGMDDCLTKPVRMENLYAAIEKCLRH